MSDRCVAIVRVVLAGGVALAVGACATNNLGQEALYAQMAFVGMPKQTLLSCAGVPQRQTTADNLEYYTYQSATTDAYGGGVATLTGPPYAFGYGYGFGFPYTAPYFNVQTTSCAATFTLKDGVVQQLTYGGAESVSNGRLSQCYYIVENCLKLVPPPPAAPKSGQ